jgi:hypothetical protein
VILGRHKISNEGVAIFPTAQFLIRQFAGKKPATVTMRQKSDRYQLRCTR